MTGFRGKIVKEISPIIRRRLLEKEISDMEKSGITNNKIINIYKGQLQEVNKALSNEKIRMEKLKKDIRGIANVKYT